MDDQECPICTDPLAGSVVTLGCCKKVMHLECIVKCMKQNLDCPMCRTRHESLRMVQDIESQVLVPVLVPYRNKNFFRNAFFATIATTILIISIEYRV
jgi:Ring finger domain